MQIKNICPFRLMAMVVFAAGLFLVAPAASRHFAVDAQSVQSADAGHDGMEMNMAEPMQMSGAHLAAMLADKQGSEFNHHLAGMFVVLAGVFILLAGTLPENWSFLRYVWPICFLLSGLFLAVYSDKELWPFGPQSWWFGLTHSAEVLQHKVFAAILLALGILEIQRARGKTRSAWVKWAFPVLACCGSIMLLFHEHSGAMMMGADHMATMNRIQSEHQSFAAAGFGISIFKGLAELPTRWQQTFKQVWPSLIIILGVLLLRYVE